MSRLGPHEEVLTPDKAGSWERGVPGISLVWLNLFINDPEARERKKWQIN